MVRWDALEGGLINHYLFLLPLFLVIFNESSAEGTLQQSKVLLQTSKSHSKCVTKGAIKYELALRFNLRFK